MNIEGKLKELGIELPPASRPMANYQMTARLGSALYTSGAGYMREGKAMITGKLGDDVSMEQGYQAARETALQLMSNLRAELGSLDKIKSFVKILGFVNSTDDFIRQPEVINGASDVIVEVFGDKGEHARSAIGVNTLPFDIPVEIELIVEVEEE
ncbi:MULTISPECIES: RidA family protein [Sporosarcina]|nr:MULTISPECIES: RidA family protein [Sporosarcina]MBY0223440.1 RidA family protein [Sporosarcina aquimarina]SKB06523.1 Enamine deaminase RidA, house cleaning of reactive enamine intermediates, YjgF/YER057c/UK114 family [Sporosarcina newyorkensis]